MGTMMYRCWYLATSLDLTEDFNNSDDCIYCYSVVFTVIRRQVARKRYRHDGILPDDCTVSKAAMFSLLCLGDFVIVTFSPCRRIQRAQNKCMWPWQYPSCTCMGV